MNPLVRIFLCVAILSIGSVLPAAEAEIVEPDGTLLSLFPRESKGLIFVDVLGLRTHEWVRESLERWRAALDERAAEFSRRTGLDPVDDVNQVLLGWTADEELLVVLRGTHDARDMAGQFREEGIAGQIRGDWTIYQVSPESGSSLALAADLVLIGPTDSVRDAIDREATSATSALDNADLAASIDLIDDSSQVWGVGGFAAMLIPDVLTPPMAIDLIAALQQVTYQMRVDSRLTAQAVGLFASPDAAERTGELLRGVVALGKLQVMDDEDLSQLLDGFEITNLDTTVDIHFSADAELLKRASESATSPPPLAND